jgi:catechol 2,3-dioxygenase-like lactoylglutathione lyase family enzyme
VSSSYVSSRDVIVRTDAWPEAVRFYESVLGWRVLQRDNHLVGFETGSFCLYVEKGPAHGAVFEVLVPDVELARAQLLAAGCVVLEEDRSVPRCYVRDPQGLVFNIGQART